MAGDVRKLGIGIQDFKKLREGGYVYVDKTEYLYRLISLSTPFSYAVQGVSVRACSFRCCVTTRRAKESFSKGWP